MARTRFVMAKDSSKEKLVEFLNRKAFEPILRASPDDYKSEADKKALADVQRKTETEVERYARYPSAQKVRQMFKDDLNSAPAQKVDRELHRLGLPRLCDIKSEFDQLCEREGVE
jgi:hypothetical protein